MGTSLDAPPAAWTQALDRHQLWRRQGIPTLSVLAGDPADTVALWREWAGAAGYQCVVEDAAGRLEDHGETGLPPAARLTIAPHRVDGEHPAHFVKALAATVRRLCAEVEKLGPAQSSAVLALAVEPADAAAYLRDAPECRDKAFFREGLISLDALHPSALESLAADGNDQPGTKAAHDGTPAGGTFFAEFARTHAALAQQHASPQTFASFRAAASALREVKGTAEIDPDEIRDENNASANHARSAAEQFLFDLLAELPETAGLFALNVKLGFCFGPMPAEVDLLAAGLWLAVEIDGYHHFRDPDGYRRDRRKDALLQKQGYLVVRFLAEDVVARLEDILAEIRAAVAFCRITRGNGR
jgi:hypothetical protein